MTSYTLIRIAIDKIAKAYGIVMPTVKETVYRDGKMIFLCENGERFWYSFANDIVAKIG